MTEPAPPAPATLDVDPRLLEILVCPLCKAAVELQKDGRGLKCVECHRVYPIRDDIPVMLESEARTLGAEEVEHYQKSK